jgi:flagellar biosynthesis/type III secretory pathway ATPase
MEIIEQIDEFLKEMILYCEDEEDLISMGALLQIQSKYILTAVMQREDWSKIINEYVKDSVNEPRTSINIEEILNKLK